MLSRGLQWVLIPVILALALVEWAAGAGTVRHSGTLTAIDHAAGTIVVEP